MDIDKKYLISGAILAGTVAVGAYLYTKQSEKQVSKNQQARNVNRDLVIKILKEIDKEMFSILTNMALIANQIKEQARGRVSNQELRDFMLNQNKELRDEIQNTVDKVLDKYGLEELDLRHACEVSYKEDRDIKQLMNEAKLSLEKATVGNPPDVRTTLPPFLTAELTLQLLEKIMRESLVKIKEKFLALKAEGVSLSYNNPQLLMALHELRLDDIKKTVLSEAELDKFDDPATKIFQYATQKYSQENPNNFNQKLMKLEFKHQKAMESLMKDPEGAQTLIDSIGDHLHQPAEPQIVSTLKNKSEFFNPFEKMIEKEEEEPNELTKSSPDLFIDAKNELTDEFKSLLMSKGEIPAEFVNSALHTLKMVFENYESKSLSRSQLVRSNSRKSDDDKKNNSHILEEIKQEEQNKNEVEDVKPHSEDHKEDIPSNESKEDSQNLTLTPTKEPSESKLEGSNVGLSPAGKYLGLSLEHQGDHAQVFADEDSNEYLNQKVTKIREENKPEH